MTVFIQYLVNGLSMGSVYAIIALGYTMVYGIAKMLNFAHGDVIMVGAYVSFCATSYLGLPGWVSVILSCVVCTVLGVLIEGLAYKPLRQAGPLAVLITLSACLTSCRTPRSFCGAPRPRTSLRSSPSRCRSSWPSST